MRALKIAATGMTAQQMRVEIISNNLSNMNTTGYNARRAEFSDLHYQQIARAGTVNAAVERSLSAPSPPRFRSGQSKHPLPERRTDGTVRRPKGGRTQRAKKHQSPKIERKLK